ncbi:hypothetical protein V8C35DRAFT_284838 [Trichoderma chlorosporum]
MARRPSRREDFEVAVICALPLEYDAVVLLFDEFWDNDGDTFGRAAGDNNTYTTGRIGKHDVVLALLPHMGKARAAAAAASLRSSYGALRLVILAGICGGVPRNGQYEMFLGDVIISRNVIQYDFGRQYPNKFIRKDTVEDNLRKHDNNIRSFLAKLDTDSEQDKLRQKAVHFLNQLQDKTTSHQSRYKYPGIAQDKLFEPNYRHKHHHSAVCVCNNGSETSDTACDAALTSSCEDLGCDEEYLVKRSRPEAKNKQNKPQEPAIYIGTVASGDAVMKSGEDRDRIAREEGVIAFEMEGAGAWEEVPCIVVKGICDYADCHKNKLWQHFAAATAASACKAMLERYVQTDKPRGSLLEGTPRSHFLVPFGRNENFVGRENILSKLLEKIRPGANKDDCQRTAIEGLGGVGKTQIALEAIYLLHNEYPDYSIFWVPAINRATFESAYLNIGRQLEVKGIDDDTADVKQLVNRALSEEGTGSWLLIIDNADDIALLFGINGLLAHLPFSRNGSILLTTRNHNVTARLDITKESIAFVEEMEQGEALSLLLKGLNDGQTSNVEATKRLLEFLANLPLAIRQASAYMATTYISTSKYLDLCESDYGDFVELLSRNFEDRYRYKEAQNPVAKTWLISFNQILQHNPLAAKFLKFMSILVEKDIPMWLLPTAGRIDTIDAIGTLKAYAFITQRDGEDSFDVHRLVRLAMRNWLEKEGELKECTISAIQRLDQALPFPKYGNKVIWMNYLPHAQAVLEHPQYFAGNKAEANISAIVAECNFKLGRYQTTEEMYRQALKLYERALGKEHLSTIITIDNLALILRKLGKPEEAEKMHQQASKLSGKVFGKEYPGTLVSITNHAIALGDLGKFKEAEKMHQHVFKLRQKVLSKEHPDTLDSMDNLAVVLRHRGKYKDAEKINREALELREKVLDKEHPFTINSRNNLALVLGNLGKYHEAERMHRQALESFKRVLGEEHPDTIMTMDNLALISLRRMSSILLLKIHHTKYTPTEIFDLYMSSTTMDVATNLAPAKSPSSIIKVIYLQITTFNEPSTPTHITPRVCSSD